MRSLLALFLVLSLAGLLMFVRSSSGVHPEMGTVPSPMEEAAPAASPAAEDALPAALAAPKDAAATERRALQDPAASEAKAAASSKLVTITIYGEDFVTGEPLLNAPFHYQDGNTSHVSALGSDGSAQLKVKPGNRLLSIRLLRTDTYAGSLVEYVRPDPESEPSVTLLSLLGGALKGAVVNKEGKAARGAKVRVWNSRSPKGEPDVVAIADAGGSFSIPRIGPEFVASASTETLVGVRGLRGKIDAETRCKGLELVVGPAAIFEGRVLGSKGSALEGAHLKLSSGLNSRSSADSTGVVGISTFRQLGGAVRENLVTGSDGAFRFEGEPAGHIQVRVEAHGHVGDWISFKTEDSPVTIELEEGLVIRGAVFLPSGQPADGAKVRYSPAATNTGVLSNEGLTDANGKFTLRGFDPDDRDEAFLTVSLEGYAVAAVEPPAFDSGQGEANDFRLEQAEPLAGTVRHPGGEPAAEIRIEVDGGGRFEAYNPFVGQTRTFESAADVEKVRTDENGQFTYRYRRQGPATLKVWPTNDPRKWINVDVSAAEENVEIILDPALVRKVALLGTVVDAATGEPLQEIKLLPWLRNGASSHRLETDQGAFELTGLEPGPMKIEIAADGYADQVILEKDFENGDHELGTIRLQPATRVSLLIVDLEGEPWNQGALRVLDADGQAIDLKTGGFSSSTSLFLRGDPLHFSGVPAGPITLRVTAEGMDQDVPFDPTQTREGDIARVTIEPPQPPKQASLVLVAIRRAALEEPDQFVADMQAALEGEDKAWPAQNMKTLIGAGPREKITIRVNPPGGFGAEATMSWNADTGDYSTSTNVVTSSSPGSSYSTQEGSPHIPVPTVQMSVPTRGGAIEFEIFQGESKVFTQSVSVDTSKSNQPIILLY